MSYRRQGGRYIFQHKNNLLIGDSNTTCRDHDDKPIRGIHYDISIIFIGADAYRSIKQTNPNHPIFDKIESPADITAKMLNSPKESTSNLDDTLPDIRLPSIKRTELRYG